MISTTKGTDLFKGLTLIDSPNYMEYVQCFLDEFDELFYQAELVATSRYLETATGAQLDVIGVILGQERSVVLPNIWFGFAGVPDVDGMADEVTPNQGGIFRSEESEGYVTTPLDDETYRRLLKSKALLLNSDTCDIETAYKVVCTLLNKVPKVLSFTSVGFKEIELNLAYNEVNNSEVALISYCTKYFVPLGITLTIIRT